MKFVSTVLISAFVMVTAAFPASAQLDEIVVTGTRIDDSPGIFLEKKGDFLLLEVGIENDSRELATRMKEISETVDHFVLAANKDDSIKLSIIDDSDFVRPLSMSNFRSGIRSGARPDTSVAYLKVKTEIPDEVADAYKLATKLSDFVETIEEAGRTKVTAYDEVSVSVVNPYQYRLELLDVITSEIKTVTDKLGPDYRAVIRGLDKDLDWSRSGDLNLAFYIPYEYDIVPTSLREISVTINE